MTTGHPDGASTTADANLFLRPTAANVLKPCLDGISLDHLVTVIERAGCVAVEVPEDIEFLAGRPKNYMRQGKHTSLAVVLSAERDLYAYETFRTADAEELFTAFAQTAYDCFDMAETAERRIGSKVPIAVATGSVGTAIIGASVAMPAGIPIFLIGGGLVAMMAWASSATYVEARDRRLPNELVGEFSAKNFAVGRDVYDYLVALGGKPAEPAAAPVILELDLSDAAGSAAAKASGKRY